MQCPKCGRTMTKGYKYYTCPYDGTKRSIRISDIKKARYKNKTSGKIVRGSGKKF